MNERAAPIAPRSPHLPATGRSAILVGLWLATAPAIVQAEGPEPDRQGIEFFEKRIRPILVEHCYECHSGRGKIKGGLRLDSRAGWEKGGDSGPAAVPGKPEESLIVEAVRSTGDLEMPPKGRLPQAIVDDFERWVKLGAPDPRRTVDGAQPTPARVGATPAAEHWAYRQVTSPALPAVRDAGWPRNSIDRFILTRLESAGFSPAGPADRETLVRRIYFDLIGLPPTPAQIDEFLADRAPDAWERLVDRLLDSPEFGERWGRHWLDVVRFAESLTLRGFVFKQAWRYRDYVIDSFNHDVPFDQFLREQIAGDLLTADSISERQRQLVATTVLVLGNTNLEEQDKQQLEMDLVDEQLDVIGRGFLAQTITCARCHDHKFDPIPTRDYYALAGILKNAKALDHENVSKWVEVPLPLEPEREAHFRRHEAELAASQQRIQELQAELKQLAGTAVAAAGSEILQPKDLPGIVVDDVDAKRVGEWQHSQYSKRYIGNGYLHDIDGGKGSKTLTFAPELPASGKYEVRFAYTPGDNRAQKVPATVFSADGEKTIFVNERETPPIDGRLISLGEYRFERGGQSFVIVSNEGTTGHVIADAVQFISLDGTEPKKADRAVEAAEPPSKSGDEFKRMRDEIKRLEDNLRNDKTKGPRRPTVMSVAEKSQVSDLYIHIRGSVHNRGPVVPRGFLGAASQAAVPVIPVGEGGRRQLAEWLTRPENPLTARVFVNRAWHWLLGVGLVRTTDNFGTTGEDPSHPELLDHLATTFVADGWSVKQLLRRIVLSQTYQLSGGSDQRLHGRADPENRLFGRMNRSRLDAECLRDAMLQISGALRADRGGPGFRDDLASDYGYVDASNRRSVYVPVFRNALPEVFDAFDFADPSTVTGRRNTSTVAPQALFLMNHPFVIAQARLAAERLVGAPDVDKASRLTRAWRQTLGRKPNRGEEEAARRFLSGFPADDPKQTTAAWAQLFQSLFATVDFRYLE